MPVGRLAVSRQRADTRHRARLRMHIVAGVAVAHALAERAVNPGYRHYGVQGRVNAVMLVGVFEERHLQFGRHVVVKRQSAAVGYVIL